MFPEKVYGKTAALRPPRREHDDCDNTNSESCQEGPLFRSEIDQRDIVIITMNARQSGASGDDGMNNNRANSAAGDPPRRHDNVESGGNSSTAGGGGANISAGAATTTMVITQQNAEADNNVLRLSLRPRPNVTWDQGVVNNEGLGRKSSKRCCIFHKQRAFGESSTESSGGDDSGDDGSTSSSSGGGGSGKANTFRTHSAHNPDDSGEGWSCSIPNTTRTQ